MRTFLIPLNFYPYYRLPSYAELNLLNARALVEYEEARKANMLNQILWTEIFFKMREMNREYRKKEKEAIQKPLTKERIKELARKGAPRRLSKEEFDTITGKINYPIVLTDSIFSWEVDNVNFTVSKFVTTAQRKYNDYELAQKAIDKLQESLKENVSKYNGGLYGRAANFLRSLEYELRLLV
jgi:hypothetical protein